jgi:hypothetical protein
MLKFLKMTVAEDAITMEEILEVDLVEEDAKVALTAKEVVLLQEEKVVVEKADSVVTEIVQHQEEKVVLEAKEAALLQEEKAVFLIEHLDELKVLVILQDQEDQEEVNPKSLIFL